MKTVDPGEQESVWLSEQPWRDSCQKTWGLPKHIDLLRFAQDEQSLSGAFGLNRLKRLLSDLPEQSFVRNLASVPVDSTGVVWFELLGQTEVGRLPQVRLKVQAKIGLHCQRCLQPMWLRINESVLFDVVRREGALTHNPDGEAVDPDEPDQLVTDSAFDVTDLIEDQLILAVPYVPRHGSCEPAVPVVQEEPEQPKVSPFQGLSALKRR